FTNAGMNQFKGIFLGQETRDYSRAVSAQKCIRVSGKHNDLEEVGRDGLHHTFFEMLGNWSFGDYYKKEAIEFAWEFLTVTMGLPKDRLWASVFTEDDEAAELWPRVTDLPAKRILRFGAKENFWEMGETGPCGPCSELHFDRGPEFGCGKPDCDVNCDCERFLEIWNLVFIQYDRDETGRLTELPAKHVDTGMGLERLASLMQKASSNYGTDLFMPIIEQTAEFSGKDPDDPRMRTSMWVIADHIRALTFAIADGAMPSNEGRGYVLRRILRRAARHGRLLDLHEPFIYKLAGVVVDNMGEAYPELHAGREHVALVIKSEEERFGQTLDQGIEKFDQLVADLNHRGVTTVPGEEAFRLYDTYGFPADLTQVMAQEKGMDVDLEGFEQAMTEQKKRSREVSVATDVEIQVRNWKNLSKGKSSLFVGYDTCVSESIIRKWDSLENNQVEVVLDKTPFYAEAGGQQGDRGQLIGEGFTIDVTNTVHKIVDQRNEIVHLGKLTEGTIGGAKLRAEVSSGQRKATARNHTATHLLQAALRQVLGSHVHQSGSMVTPERLRFDFTHYSAMSPVELKEVEALVNAKIRENIPVATFETSLDDARAQGVTALFGEKYDQQVRVVQLADTSQELCGGTHVEATGEIGLFVILSEGGIAAGVRRIEGVTGEGAYGMARRDRQTLRDLAERLKTNPDQLFERVDKLLADRANLEKKLKNAAAHSAATHLDDILAAAEDVEGLRVATAQVEADGREALLNAADSLRKKLRDGVGVLGSTSQGSLLLVAVVGEDALKTSGLRAGDIVREVAAVIGGKGGGKPHLAQGGGKDPAKLPEALAAVKAIVQKLLRKDEE
ncbi:alanine--tRNA ligase, partial [Candidatus Zixiibacteriota bacterium]